MTVVVYKDGKIASDSRATIDDLIVSDRITKIAKGPGCIGGGSGDADTLPGFIKWVEDGADLSKAPDKKHLYGIVAYKPFPRKQPRVVRIEEKGYFDVTLEKGEVMCIGSGGEVAWGAVEAGATVEKAVEIAIKLISSCGGKVQVVSL